MKLCSSCKAEKEITEFHKCRAKKDGLHHKCKSCVSLYNCMYYKKNTKKLAIYKKDYRQKNSEYIKEKNKSWRINNKEYIQQKGKEYRLENKDKLLYKNRRYRSSNREKVNKYDREYRRKRNKEDINYRIRNNLRSRLVEAVKNKRKAGSAVQDLGCSIEKLRSHLEELFLPGMSWDNYGKGGWNIDHIIPLCAFDLTDKQQVIIACHYTNLQPLWEQDNFSKGGKI